MNEVVQGMLQKYSPKSPFEHERALREILQEISLVGLWRGKFFEHAAFYGGTALRILYGLDRFSEDLDFTLYKADPNFQWAPYAKTIVDEMHAYGFEVELVEKKKSTNSAVKSAFLKANTLESLLKIGVLERHLKHTHPETLLRIKVEIDTDPIPGLQVKNQYIRAPIPVSISTVVESDLFACKLHAALYRAWKNRVKGRDWYDVIWFIRREIPLNLNYLSTCMHNNGELAQNERLTSSLLTDIFVKRLKTLDIDDAKADVRTFLRDTTQLQEWSTDFFLYWFSKITFA
jgi:predicted nucleotidyltransferase component of viral defense system